MLDLIIREALVVDGTAEPHVLDVGIVGDRIVAVGRGLGSARRSIDGRGRLLAPGFIDIHTHSDFTLPVRPAAPAKLLQGVTTDVTGNCGFSPFPLTGDTPSLHHGRFIEAHLDERWPSLDAYAEDLESRGLGINIAPLVGLGAIRLAVLGEDAVPADARSITEMSSVLRTMLAQGAFGASSGLVYAPSSFADLDELSALAGVVGEVDGLYATHMRNEGALVIESVEEAIETSRRAHCKLQISHLKALGKSNWGRVADALARIDQANLDGCDVWVDAYPYTACSSMLASLLPAAELDGGDDAMRRRLADPFERARLTALLRDGTAYELEGVVLASVATRPELSGRRLVEVASESGTDPAELVLQLLEIDGAETSMVTDGMDERDVQAVLAAPRTMIGSDGWTMATDAEHYTHPRNFATTVRLLARYARDEHLLDISSAIGKLTSQPARRLGLTDRGLVAVGAVADLVLFDLERLSENATYEEPCAYPTGIEHVLVRGEIAVEDGALTDVRGGAVLRRPLASSHP
jgi:N-acyl-D-amino-acid deacylase